jgi:hypothetical protein
MAIEILELHYHLIGDSHAMNAVVRNKSESEALALCIYIAAELGIPLQLESSAYTKGGLREIWQFIGQNSAPLSVLISVIIAVLSRVPVSDSAMDALNKEVAKLTIEEKKLSIEKLKRELNSGYPEPETISTVAHVFERDLKVATRRSNFYSSLLDYEKVTAVGFAPSQDPQMTPIIESTVRRPDFWKFILTSDTLPVEVVEEARIEIVSPVLKEGNYQWKGIYADQPIIFKMLDQVFKTAVLRRDISFQNGSTIECVLNIHRKFDKVGNVNITGCSVATVLSLSDGVKSQETLQGKRYRSNKRLIAAQGNLFDQIQ